MRFDHGSDLKQEKLNFGNTGYPSPTNFMLGWGPHLFADVSAMILSSAGSYLFNCTVSFVGVTYCRIINYELSTTFGKIEIIEEKAVVTYFNYISRCSFAILWDNEREFGYESLVMCSRVRLGGSRIQFSSQIS
jgi:hypothetical protein